MALASPAGAASGRAASPAATVAALAVAAVMVADTAEDEAEAGGLDALLIVAGVCPRDGKLTD